MWNKWTIIVAFGLIPLCVKGQKVGLVLSGGGSKGLAHIGVIKALEENRIPIDYIGGTSMGAIIGGFYAIGMTTDEMIQIIRSEEFNYWLEGEIEEKYRYYFKEELPGPDIIRIGLDVKDTIPKTRLPLSLVPNYLMDFAFMEIFSRASAAAGYDFDSLFVPFLCNAVDISNNREIVFRKGELSQAVRASMTVPLYFRPILIDGNIMYDGGIYNNFPLNHVKKHFNPDVVIGSKAAEGNKPPDEFDILAQIENIVMKPSGYAIDKDEGILLDLDLARHSLLSFEKLDEFVEAGYSKTIEKMDSIRMLIYRKAESSGELDIRRDSFRRSWPPFLFSEVETEGLNEKQEFYLKRSIRKSDSILNIDQLKREYLKAVNDQGLRYLYPRAIFDEKDSLFRLKLRVIPESPLEARFGIFFSTTGLSETYLGFSYREISEVSTHLRGSVQFGRLYDGLHLGLRFDYPSRIPVYFHGSFNYNRFDYNTTSRYFFFQDLKPSYIIENEINFRFDAGFPYSINGLVKGGIGIGRNRQVYYMTRDFTSSDTSDISNVNLVSIYASTESNTLNEKQFDTEGNFRKFAIRAGYGFETYTPGSTSLTVTDERMNYFWLSLKFENSGYISMSEKFSLGYSVVMHAAFKPLMSNYLSTIIEAPVFQPNLITKGLFMENYRAHQYLAAGIKPIYHYNNNVYGKFEAYAFMAAQEILMDENNEAYLGNNSRKIKTLFNASVNFITPAGPLGIHAGYLTEESRPWVIQLSFGYLIFNKKSNEE